MRGSTGYAEYKYFFAQVDSLVTIEVIEAESMAAVFASLLGRYPHHDQSIHTGPQAASLREVHRIVPL